jgi:hypothetical protein
MMKQVIALLVFVCLSAQTYAQYSLSGTVTDNSHQPLAGAHVIIKSTYYQTVTNDQGHFQFSGIKRGYYVLLTSFVGFETRQDSVEISGDQNLELTLKESAFVTDAVIISAVRASQNTPTKRLNGKTWHRISLICCRISPRWLPPQMPARVWVIRVSGYAAAISPASMLQLTVFHLTIRNRMRCIGLTSLILPVR